MIKMQHERDGELIPYEWSWFEGAAMIEVILEFNPELTWGRVGGEYTVPERFHAYDENDPKANIVFEPGDIIRVWRD